ncbi:MAG: spermidine synthase [Candidatus Methylacidiphilales bacterium]
MRTLLSAPLPRWVYLIAIFLGSFQLFLVQPLAARQILPDLGGSPAIWKTCMMFFQLFLLGGYAYAHYGRLLLGARTQGLLHVFLLVVASGWGLATGFWMPAEGGAVARPVIWLVSVLAVNYGLPFFLLAANSPLIQCWYAGSGRPDAHAPYFLYSASNVASLLALLAYPLVLEPWLHLKSQQDIWLAILPVTALACFGCVWKLMQQSKAKVSDTEVIGATSGEDPPTWRRRLKWVAMAAVPSSLLLSVTQFVTTDIASMPLLWVIPLGLYLITFILVFSSCSWPGRMAKRSLLPVVLVLAFFIAVPWHGFTSVFIIHFALFFVVALALHQILAEDRPSSSHLTSFYLSLSAGGALGGVFNSLIAPAVFDHIAEYAWGAVAAACFWMMARRGGRLESQESVPFSRCFFYGAPMVLAGVMWGILYLWGGDRSILFPVGMLCVALSFLMVHGHLLLSKLPRSAVLAPVLTALVLFFGGRLSLDSDVRVIHRERNFFGVSTVKYLKNQHMHLFQHGTTVHGAQSLKPEWSRRLLSYYGPIPEIMNFSPSAPEAGALPIGLVGLGAGVCAVLAHPQQEMDAFEIDDAVLRIAADERFFTYLRDCQGRLKIIHGDGRIELRKIEAGRYGLLLMDAYTSDALPVHLLTRDAIKEYLRVLHPDGIVVFNVSNRHMNIHLVAGAIAQNLGLSAYYCDYPGDEPRGLSRAQYVIMSRNASVLSDLATVQPLWRPLSGDVRYLWTDHYSPILPILKR